MSETVSNTTIKKKNSLKLLIVGDLFPTDKRPQKGIFMVRQASLLRKYGIESSFLVTKPFLPWPLSKIGPWSDIYGIPTLPSNYNFKIKSTSYPRPPGEWFRPYEGFSKSIPAVLNGIKWHRQRRFDAVLGIDMTSGARAAVSIGKKLGIPVASLAIGSDVMLRTNANPKIAKEISAILKNIQLPMGVSSSVCTQIAALGSPLQTPLHVYLGREPYQTETRNLEQLRQDFGWAKDSIVAVFAGRISIEKGIEELATVSEKLLKLYPKLKIVCIGDGPLRKRMEKINYSIKRSDAVVVTNWIKPEEVFARFIASNFLVFPSHSEGLPQVILEAMDAGLPVIGTRVGGIPEAVIDEETGILIDKGKEDQLELAMIRLIEDRAFRENLGRAAQLRATEVFDSEKNAKKMASAIFDLVECN